MKSQALTCICTSRVGGVPGTPCVGVGRYPCKGEAGTPCMRQVSIHCMGVDRHPSHEVVRNFLQGGVSSTPIHPHVRNSCMISFADRWLCQRTSWSPRLSTTCWKERGATVTNKIPGRDERFHSPGNPLKI